MQEVTMGKIGLSESEMALMEQAKADAVEAAAEAAKAVMEAAESEILRGRAEDDREAAEEDRAIAELARQEAEAYRQAKWAEIEQKAKGFEVRYCATGEYDAETLVPTIADPDPKTLYLVPDERALGGNAFREWICVEGTWERLGAPELNIIPISADQMDAIVAGTDADGDGSEVLTRWGLRYWLTKIKGVFAPLLHKHSASDISSGTLDPARIGAGTVTGSHIAANTVSKNNLEKTLQDSLSQVSMSDDVVQFNLNNNTKLRFAVYSPDDGAPYLAANMMVGGSWLGMKRLLNW